MVHVAYPLEFPLSEIEECIRIVTGKSILKEKELFAAACWNVQGFAQKMLIGAPDALPQDGLPKAIVARHHQRLRSVLMTVDPAVDAPQALPAWLVMLVNILVQILSELGE